MGLKAGSVTANGLLGKQIAPEDLGYLAGLILAPSGSEFATDTAALLESNWLTEINSADGLRHIVLPIGFDLENEKEETQYQTSSTGNIAKIRAGKLTQTYIVKVTPFVMSQLNTLNGTSWDLYKVTSNNYITGTSVDGIKFQPFTLQNFNVEGETPAGGDAVALVPVTFTHGDASEWNSRPSFINPVNDAIASWNPINLKDPKAITVKEVTNEAITGCTVALEGYDKVAQEGVVLGDIGIWDSSGVAVSVTGVSATATAGTYDVLATLTTLLTYTIALLPVGSTTTNGAASLAADRTEFTIP